MLNTVADWLFDPEGLTPHGFCLLWEPWLIALHAFSDAAIGIAYFTIPLALVAFVRRRRDLVFKPMFWLFASFILLCGTEHWFEILTLWVPAYGAQGVVKAATATVSVLTAIGLWWLLPRALALPSPAQLREANAALRESEARHRASFELSPVPIHILNGDGIITDVSDSWLHLLRYAPADVIGRPIDDFIAAGSPGWAAKDRNTLLEYGQLRDLERRFRRHDGEVIDALVSSRLERRDGATWIVCVLIDITARRKAEAALRTSEERLRHAQKMEAVGQLTGGIAHDFNNMLQGIGGALELMERRIATNRVGEVQPYIDAARQSVGRAAGLTNRMLAFARRQALLPTSVEPDELIRGMDELIRRTVGPAIQVTLQLGGGAWSALCDANQLESALLNLAINARDAMPDGGTLTIATADEYLSAAELVDTHDTGEAEPGDYVEIAVSDTGCGMTQDVQARAFEPFFTTKPTGQGTGLGLSQIYGFVRQSGGIVRLESQVGEGTTVRLYLPRRELGSDETTGAPKELQRRLAHGEPATTMGGRIILVIEDEDTVRSVVTEALETLGCRILQARDGAEGLRLVQSGTPFDMLVTDVGLPGLNGRQLADAARQHRPDLPILLITGYAGSALDDMGLAHGMELTRKPFMLDAFAAQVRRMLDPALAPKAHPAA